MSLGASIAGFLSEDYAPFLLLFLGFVLFTTLLAIFSSFKGPKAKTFRKNIQLFLEGWQNEIFVGVGASIFFFITSLFSLPGAIIGAAILSCLTKLLLLAESKNSKTFEFLLVGVLLLRIIFNRVDLAGLGYLGVLVFLYQVVLQFRGSEPLTVFVKGLKESQLVLKKHKAEGFYLLSGAEKIATLFIFQSVVFPLNHGEFVSSFMSIFHVYSWCFIFFACVANVIVVNVFNAPTRATYAAITNCAACVGAGCGVASVYMGCVDMAINPAKDPGQAWAIKAIQRHTYKGVTAPTRASLQACQSWMEVHNSTPPTFPGTDVVDFHEVQRQFDREKDPVLKQKMIRASKRSGFN